VISTPDQGTMFINMQHPGATTSAEGFAAGKLNSRFPRVQPPSSLLVMTAASSAAF